MQIDDVVRVIGPDSMGADLRKGEKFKITEIVKDDEILYSTGGFDWYPESSLELCKALKIGDLVRITGPDVYKKQDSPKGTEFTVSQTDKTIPGAFPGCGAWYSDMTFSAYPASSLELVDDAEKRLASIEAWKEMQLSVNLRHADGLIAIEKQLAEFRERLHDLEEQMAKDQKNSIDFTMTLDTSGFCEELEKAAKLARNLAEPAVVSQVLDEPKVGDWVQVIGPAYQAGGCPPVANHIGEIFRITDDPEKCKFDYGCKSHLDHYSNEDMPMYPASSLRPLPNDEIVRRLNERHQT